MPELSIVDIVRTINATAGGELHEPVAEQVAIIESEPYQPALVVAGAGSGKTETMSMRALWLVANGHVQPHEILGLTFTRKAAGELAHRMRQRIRQLRRAGLVPTDGESDELLDSPRIATYNSFATQLYRERAPLVGRDPDAAVLSEAGAWLLARDIVRRDADLGLENLERALNTLAGDVVALARRLGDNVVDTERLADWATGAVEQLSALPVDGTKTYDGPAEELQGRIAALPVLVDLAGRFEAEKRRRGLIEFSDQVTIALDIARAHPETGADLRRRYRAVILDEYQDTSYVQTELLRALFADHPVMAVGDPHQSIYGWRGASAANLADFGAHFGQRGPALSLTTSWRNDRRILDAANTVLQPLVAHSPVSVERLAARPGAGPGEVDVAFPQTILEEAAAVAEWFAARLLADASSPRPTAALLLRSWRHLPVFRRALRELDIPVQVLGGGGLLAEPAIADLVSALAVIDDPGAGSELVRLLVGSRWRVGTADIAALRDLARWWAGRDLGQQPIAADVAQALRDSVTGEDGASLVDALDLLADLRDDHAAVRRAGFSEEGLRRLRDAGRFFARLRRRPRFGLAELATVVIHELGLDIELRANDSRPDGMRVFEPFFDAVSGFEQLPFGNSLAAFLGWLREAATRDRLSGPLDAEPLPGGVQLLTIHGAKGLEWDYVTVPRLVVDELPGRSADKETWLQFGKLPYPFRGDAAELPDFRWEEARDRRELAAARGSYQDGERERQIDEARRLAYVGITRARRGLLLTGSWWAGQSESRAPSRFLTELADAGVIGELPGESARGEKVVLEPGSTPWPRDPLGGRRARVEEAARLVNAQRDAPGAALDRAGGWADEIRLLLAERDARDEQTRPPLRIPASRFHEYLHDPEGVLADLRRPMPQRPYRATRRGTDFHSWVEKLFSPDGVSDELDLGFDVDEDDIETQDAAALAELKTRFEASDWPSRTPLEIECEIDIPFGGHVVICRIDAVFPSLDDPDRVEIVDWKTGRLPTGEELRKKQLQLALYRLAYAKRENIDPKRIDATFYYVEHDATIRADELPSEEELLRRWRETYPGE